MKERIDGEHPFGDIGQLLFFLLFLFVWVWDSFFLKKSIFLADYVPFVIRIVLSAAILLLAFALYKDSKRVISHKVGPVTVITDGVFKLVRHPLYLSTFWIFVALSIFSLSLFSFAVLLAMFIFLNYIASFEEKVMEKRFGKKYLEYKSKTGKWFPKL